MKTLIAAALFLGLAGAAQAMPRRPAPRRRGRDPNRARLRAGHGPQRQRPLPPGLHGAALPARNAPQRGRHVPPLALTSERRVTSSVAAQPAATASPSISTLRSGPASPAITR